MLARLMACREESVESMHHVVRAAFYGMVFSIILIFFNAPASAAQVKRSFGNYSVRGLTMAEIGADMARKGPQLTGNPSGNLQSHPAITRMEFKSSVQYGESHGRCRITRAVVTVNAHIIMPQWRDRRRATVETRIFWDSLAQDIRRHEEGHLTIAKDHATRIEAALLALKPQAECSVMDAEVARITETLLRVQDSEQEQFDKIELRNFTDRINRLISYRMEQIEAGRLRY